MLLNLLIRVLGYQQSSFPVFQQKFQVWTYLTNYCDQGVELGVVACPDELRIRASDSTERNLEALAGVGAG